MNEPTSLAPPEAASEAVDDQGRLIEDIGCRRCGYNLRSLETDAVCPECGAAVAISIHGYYLRFAPLAWVRRLALGAKLLPASKFAAAASAMTLSDTTPTSKPTLSPAFLLSRFMTHPPVAACRTQSGPLGRRAHEHPVISAIRRASYRRSTRALVPSRT